MPLDYTQIQEKLEMLAKFSTKLDEKRQKVRFLLRLFSEIQFIKTQVLVEAAILAVIKDGKIIKEAVPAKYETKNSMPPDRSLQSQKLKPERQQEIYDDCIAQLEKIGIKL